MADFSLYTFFTELAGYMGTAEVLSGSNPSYLQGVGAEAPFLIPDMFNNFSDIKALMYLEWYGSGIKDNVRQQAITHNIPFIHIPGKGDTPGVSRLYLPVNTLTIPYTAITSDIKQFRGESKDSMVNVVVYKENDPTFITMAMILRNNKFSPWAGYMAYIIGRIAADNVGFLTLVVPRLSIDMRYGNSAATGKLKLYSVRGRITRFAMDNIGTNRCAAVLTFLPNDQNMELLETVGVMG